MVSVVHAQVEVTQILILVETLFHAAQRMERRSFRMGAGHSWTSTQSRTMAVSSGSPFESRKAGFTAGPASECQSEGCSTKIPKSVTVVRERRTPEQVRSDASCWGCGREEGFADGFGEGPETSRGAPVGAPDPGHECGQGQETDARSGREDQGGDIRELPLAEARLERLQKEVPMSRPATPGPEDDRQMDGGLTYGTPGCDRIWRPGVDPRNHGFDSQRCGTAQEIPLPSSPTW